MKKRSFTACMAILAASGSLLLTQCKKSDNNENAKSTLLKSAAWKYKEAAIDADNNGTAETPLPAATLQQCDIDNTLSFKTDTSGVVDEGATKCDVANPQQTTFKYSYNSSTNIINFSTAIFAGISGDAKVLELTATQMRISKAVPLTGSPISITIIVTLVH